MTANVSRPLTQRPLRHLEGLPLAATEPSALAWQKVSTVEWSDVPVIVTGTNLGDSRTSTQSLIFDRSERLILTIGLYSANFHRRADTAADLAITRQSAAAVQDVLPLNCSGTIAIFELLAAFPGVCYALSFYILSAEPKT